MDITELETNLQQAESSLTALQTQLKEHNLDMPVDRGSPFYRYWENRKADLERTIKHTEGEVTRLRQAMAATNQARNMARSMGTNLTEAVITPAIDEGQRAAEIDQLADKLTYGLNPAIREAAQNNIRLEYAKSERARLVKGG